MTGASIIVAGIEIPSVIQLSWRLLRCMFYSG
jgi:hypothetical protein